jgi:hypothetical protein
LHYDCGEWLDKDLKTMGAGQKKVVVRTFAGALAWGYLPQAGFVREDSIELMAVDGRLSGLSVNGIKTISYVRDFNLDDSVDPERMGRKTFQARPRGDGLWVKLSFRDGEEMEGLTTFDIGVVDSVLEDGGIFLRPPDARANTQRIFVPRTALRAMEVLGFVTAPSKRGVGKAGAGVIVDTQARLFGE